MLSVLLYPACARSCERLLFQNSSFSPLGHPPLGNSSRIRGVTALLNMFPRCGVTRARSQPPLRPSCLGRRYMPIRNLLRKVFLCIALGGHSVFAVGMSKEKIEELLYAMHKTRVEMTISDNDETAKAKKSLSNSTR